MDRYPNIFFTWFNLLRKNDKTSLTTKGNFLNISLNMYMYTYKEKEIVLRLFPVWFFFIQIQNEVLNARIRMCRGQFHSSQRQGTSLWRYNTNTRWRKVPRIILSIILKLSLCETPFSYTFVFFPLCCSYFF